MARPSIHPSKKRRFVLLAIMLGLAIGLVCAIAILRLYIKQDAPRFLGNYTVDGFVPHTYLGYAPQANSIINSCKILGNDTIYCTQYTINGQGRRELPLRDSASHHVLLFGCSFTYGEGVGDDETFAARLAAGHPQLQFHNYAYSGYGPQQMLARLQFGGLQQEVGQPMGKLIYVLLPEHVYRAAAAPYYLQGWGSSSPHYALKGDSLVFYANHTQWRPTYTLWHRLLGWSGIGSLLGSGPSATQADIDLTVAIIKESKRLYLQQFPEGEFMVAIPPVAELDSLYSNLVVALTAEGLPPFTITDAYPITAPYIIVGDGHPSAEGHAALARALAPLFNAE